MADLDRQRASLAARHGAAAQQVQQLRRLGTAYCQAYGRLHAHTGELHAQFARQMGSLLHLCRHLGLQLAAVDPASQTEALALPHTAAPGPSTAAAVAAAGSECIPAAAAQQQQQPQWQPTLQLLDALRTELSIAVQLLEAQSGSAEVTMLAGVPADVAEALQRDLEGVPSGLLAAAAEQPAAGIGRRSSGSGGGGSGDTSAQQLDGHASPAQEAAAAAVPAPAHSPAATSQPVAAGEPGGLDVAAISAQACAALAAGGARQAWHGMAWQVQPGQTMLLS